MNLEVGSQYQCKKKEWLACITDDISNHEKTYKFKGYVINMNTGHYIRRICTWTLNGNYNIDHPTNFDLISIFKG